MAEEKQITTCNVCGLHDSTLKYLSSEIENKITSMQVAITDKMVEMLNRVKEDLCSNCSSVNGQTRQTLNDHENRIRNIESKIWRWGGIFLVLSIVIQVVGAAVTTAVVTTIVKFLVAAKTGTPMQP